MRERTVTSFEDLQLSLRQLDPTGIWIFRGQENAAWELVPSLYRGLEKLPPSSMAAHAEWISRLEHDIYRKFTQLVWQYRSPSSKWEEICLAQHFGVPTRLLDWTRNPIAASYFALAPGSDAPAALWCLNIAKYPFPPFLGRMTNETAHRIDLLNLISSQRPPSFLQTLSTQFVSGPTQAPAPVASRDLDDRDRGFLVILDPPLFAGRIAAQKALFSLYYSFDCHDLIWNHSEYLETVADRMGLEMLHKIAMPGDAKREIRTALERMVGINWHDLFPDLSGVGMYLSELRENRMSSWREKGEE